jgi:hypothetical protein
MLYARGCAGLRPQGMEPVTVIAGNRPTDHDFPSMNGIPGHDRFNVPRESSLTRCFLHQLKILLTPPKTWAGDPFPGGVASVTLRNP